MRLSSDVSATVLHQEANMQDRSSPSSIVDFAMPRIGANVLEAFKVTHGPRSLLGRFFLIVCERLAAKGITLEVGDFTELAEVQAENADSWPGMNPMFDGRTSDVRSGVFCIVGRDKACQGTVSGSLPKRRFQAFSVMPEGSGCTQTFGIFDFRRPFAGLFAL
jgi:hypothetical protein